MSLTSVKQQLDRLTGIEPGRHPIVSCYLKLEPRDRSRGKYLIKLKNRVKAVLDDLPRQGYGRAEREAIAADLERIQRELERPGSLPSTQGVAIFASKGLRLFEKIPVPTVHRSRLLVDRTPLVRELLAAEDEVGRLLTVVLDRKGARIFEVTAFGADEVRDLTALASRGGRFHSDRHNAPGMGEHTYNNRIRNEKQRHLNRIAEVLFDIDRRAAVHGVVLAGIGTDASAMIPFLHPYLHDRMAGVIKLNPKQATVAHVHAATLTARAEWERAQEEALISELGDALATGWGVAGVRDTLKALGRGQVRRLLVNPDDAMPGFRCAGSGRLTLAAQDCRGDGEAVAVPDVIDDAIEEALRQRVAIEVVHSPDAATKVPGLAGMLRFR